MRKAHSFIELCKDPKLAAEVALGPIEDFDFDVSILFSDLLFPLEALGMGLKYEPAPALDWYLKELSDLKKLTPNKQLVRQRQDSKVSERGFASVGTVRIPVVY